MDRKQKMARRFKKRLLRNRHETNIVMDELLTNPRKMRQMIQKALPEVPPAVRNIFNAFNMFRMF